MIPNSDTFDQQILNLVNTERAKVGADPLRINEQLDQAADFHTKDQAMMDRMTHTGSDGTNAGNRIDDNGYDWSIWAENVSQVALDPDTVMYGGKGFQNIRIQGWMDSLGHTQNILNLNLEEIGIGYATSADGSPYWTQVFGS